MTDRPAPAPGFSTRAIHRPVAPPVTQLPSSVPLYQTSTWRFETLDDFAEVVAFRKPGHVYGRGYGNPTVEAFEAVMADLEGTEAAFAFDSGMAAIHAVVTTLARAGDRIVTSRALYGGTHSLFHEVLPRYGIDVTTVDVSDPEAVADSLAGARLLYVETIDNPLVSVADLAGLAALCAQAGVPSVVDNTFASPYLCAPARLGFDYVVHSATKYIGGHSDLLGGVVCCRSEARGSIRATALEVGGAMQPLEAWLCIRGLATLALRMERHSATGQRVAELLHQSPAVAVAYYPGLPSHPSHAVARRLLNGFGGMLAAELKGGIDAAIRFCDSLEMAWIAASLGGVHTLVAHPASTTHRQVPPADRAAQGLADGLVRISVGLEDPEDVVADFGRALAAAAD
ncbi:MAG TPA: aminotransferase class I/II-fold pyridoxal phosphate-dependent enzyme [Acidimicrobiales bacterium]|nr:aminotransferase class I/II-fold pyridoxal phosphate-dependent enzyme [Acidimicrobiales bacterium]